MRPLPMPLMLDNPSWQQIISVLPPLGQPRPVCLRQTTARIAIQGTGEQTIHGDRGLPGRLRLAGKAFLSQKFIHGIDGAGISKRLTTVTTQDIDIQHILLVMHSSHPVPDMGCLTAEHQCLQRSQHDLRVDLGVFPAFLMYRPRQLSIDDDPSADHQKKKDQGNRQRQTRTQTKSHDTVSLLAITHSLFYTL